MTSRLLNTVRYLKPIQIYRQVYRPRPRLLRPALALRLRSRQGPWIACISRENPQVAPGRFRFLNQEHPIGNWNDLAIPKLWLYNLHYLSAPNTQLIRQWIGQNPFGCGIGWDPYPLSLRIVNWIKWCLAGNVLDDVALESLAAQAGYLSRTVEYRLLANHLLANAKALVFAGCFFETSHWLEQGLQILGTEIREQILSDGGHFERSPMYHALVLEDLLDLVNLSRAYPGLLPDWDDVAGRMLAWLRHMIHPDGRIAFFNDAAFGIASEPASVFDYAERLGVQPGPRALSDSGYVRLENSRAVVLFDAAPIGPDYQPGHAHADTLSFELSVDSRRALVNTGISTYEIGADRQAQRGTAAHNTVRIDGQDSSEVWSAFRVARRARLLNVTTNHETFAAASHDGYSRLKDPVIHRRHVSLLAAELRITDTVEARREHQVELFFHRHPGSAVGVELDRRLACAREKTCWYPEFNRGEANTSVVGRWKGRCPVQFVTRIPFGD